MRLSSFLRTWLATFVAFGLALAFMLVSPSALAAIAFDATPTGGQASPADIEMVQDAGNSALNAQYVGIKFSSNIALTNVYARAVITGAGYLLDAEEAQDHFVGDLAGTFKVGYWFINHPTSGNGNFRVDIYVGDPANGGALQASSSNYLLRSSDSDNSASANKIFSVSLNGGSPIELGQSFNAVVCYTVNSNARLLIQPAVSSVFNPNNLRLGDSTTSLFASSDCSGTATATLSNQLMFNGSNNAGSVRATYTFQTIGQVSVALSPLVDAKSGIYKYNPDFATFPGTTVPAPTNKVVLAKSVNTVESPGAVTVTYTLTATNTGSSTTYLDEFIDTLPSSPAAAGYVAGSSKLNGVAFGNPVITGQSLSWKDPGTKPGGQFAVPAGGTLQLSFQANIPATNGAYTNSAIAKIGAVTIDTTLATGDNVPATAVTRVGPPVLTVTKTADTPTVVNTAAGTTARYTLKVVNTGTAALGVALNDAGLPAGFTYLSTVAVNTPVGGTCLVAAVRTLTVDPVVGATAPSWGTFAVPGGCEVSVQFDASVASTVANGTYNNSATTTSTTPATITNFDGTPVATTVDNVTVTSPVLAVTKTTSTPNVAPGGLATYTVTVTNSGTANATGVKVTDTLPAGFAYASTTSVTLNDTAVAAAGFTAGGTAAVPAWDTNPSVGFTVNAGKTLVIVFRATASATTGIYNNSAAATSINAKTITNFDGTASTAEDVTVASIILTVTKTTSTPAVVNTSTGTTATYTVTVTNSGSANATGVKLSDTLPAGFTYASTSNVTLNGAVVLPANYLTAGTAAVPTWDTNPTGGFTINAGQTLVVTFVASVANTVGDGSYNNTAAVISTNATNITNFDGTATTEDVLVRSAVLTVTKTTSTALVTNTINGTTATYTVTVTNSGTAAATGVKLTDTLPAGFSYASTTSVTENGNPVTTFTVTGTTSPLWDTSPAGGFTVDPGKTLQVVFVANVASTVADGTYNNSASATSTNAKTIANFDGTLAANTVDNVTVNSAVLTATKTTSTPTVVNAPNAATAIYAITVTNSGTGEAPNVTVRDLLPTGFIYKGTVSVVLNGTATTAYTIDTSTANPLWVGTGANGFVISGGQSLVINLEATVPTTLAAGVYQNGVHIEGTAASLADYIATSNTTEDVTVTGPILKVTKTTSTPTVTNTASGTTATYTVTVVNSGTANATGVVLTDALPTGFSYANGGAATVTLNGTVLAATAFSETTGNTPSWTTNPAAGFTINPGNSLKVVFTATVASTVADGTYDNSASVTSTNAINITNFAGASSTGENVTVTSATLAVTKTTSTPVVTNSASGTTATYTITVTNSGTANATGVKVRDTLAAGFTYASTSSVTLNGASTTAYTGSGTSTVNWDTNPAGGFTINAGQTLVITFVANVSSAVTPGTYNNSASATSTNAKTIINFDGANNTSDDVTVSAPTGVSLYGIAYNDANHNLQLDGGESGTGLTLYAKLVPSAGGSALQAVAVNPTTGAYTLVTVTPGNYSIILDNNNVLNNTTTPTVPVGWIGTEMPDFRRTNVQVAATDLQNLNFGLFNGGKLSGFVFADVGTGAGTANNGVKDGSEAGIGGVTVKVTNGGGTATFDSSVTSADGAYMLWIPTAAVASTLKIVETNLAGYLSTGASMGNTGGSYDRASDSISLSNQSGGIFTGVNFGDAPVNRFIANGQQAGQPGNVVFYPHQFNAGSGGSVSFIVTSAGSWPVVVYRDTNCNGVIDTGENVVSGAITVLAADQLCLINKVTIPPGTALGALDTATLQAVFTYTNANPALGATLVVIDSTTVGAGSAGLVLTKTVDKATALPGDTINYTVSYQNNSSTPIGTIVISDATPAFTTYVSTPAPSAACIMPLPAGITACTVTTSAAPGGGTSIQWSLTGSLNPASTGQVVFAVKVN